VLGWVPSAAQHALSTSGDEPQKDKPPQDKPPQTHGIMRHRPQYAGLRGGVGDRRGSHALEARDTFTLFTGELPLVYKCSIEKASCRCQATQVFTHPPASTAAAAAPAPAPTPTPTLPAAAAAPAPATAATAPAPGAPAATAAPASPGAPAFGTTAALAGAAAADCCCFLRNLRKK
jgi:hypothetical protein